MTVNTGAYLKGLFNGAQALGDKVVASDAYFEIEGYEDLGLLIKQFPWPVLSVAGEIEVPLPMGGAMWQPQQTKINLQGGVTLLETREGHIQTFLQDVLSSQGGRFNAKVYEGEPASYVRACDIRQCFFRLDPADRDWENRGGLLMISGDLFFHYFGEL